MDENCWRVYEVLMKVLAEKGPETDVHKLTNPNFSKAQQ
jgi:hypothetical protein